MNKAVFRVVILNWALNVRVQVQVHLSNMFLLSTYYDDAHFECWCFTYFESIWSSLFPENAIYLAIVFQYYKISRSIVLRRLLIIKCKIVNRVPDVHSFSFVTDNKLNDFEVMASNLVPPVAHGYQLEFSRNEYRLCGRYLGKPPASPTVVYCESQAIGRYVYLYRKTKQYLLMCEFEAYGTRKFKI